MTQLNRTFSMCLATALVAVGLAGCGGSSLNGDGGLDAAGSGGTGTGGAVSPGTGGAPGGTGGVVGGSGGATVGTGGAGGRAGGAGGRAAGGAGGRAPACVAGDACASGFQCQVACRTGGRAGTISCFCSPNDVLACETCTATPIAACGATVVNGMSCVATDPDCDTACVNGVSALCSCTPAIGGPVWRCAQNPGTCM